MEVNTVFNKTIKVNENEIITFKDPIGTNNNLAKFIIIEGKNDSLILWLQSLENSSYALPILEPTFFYPEYPIRLLPLELQSLDLKSLSEANVYCVITASKGAIQNMTANLKAPIVINRETNIARQIALQDNKLELEYPAYEGFKKHGKTGLTNVFSGHQKVREIKETNNSTRKNRPQPLRPEI